MRALLNQADYVATVSTHAANELRKWRMTKRPIDTVKNAISEEFLELPKSASLHYQSGDIVYIGAYTQYKNVELLLEAMQFLPDITLHLLSKLPSNRRPAIEKLINRYNINDRVIIHNGVSDEQYRQLLAKCRCLITASRLEGFGLPIIEAQGLGVPVACSATEIFEEVAGKAAEFFPAGDAKACAQAVINLGKAKRSKELSKLGYQNAQRFTWESSAAAATNICREVTKQSTTE